MAQFTFSPLTPVAFLDRSSYVFGDRLAVVDEELRLTYAELADRCCRFAQALREAGVAPGDRVAALCTNSHVMLELHFSVPYAGAVLVPLNTRLSRSEIDYIIDHSGTSVLVATEEFAELARDVAARTGIVVIIDSGHEGDYESRLRSSAPVRVANHDETALLAISYTSGTTGRPKGVMYHHRGAYLQALAMAYHARLTVDSCYLWTLPQFHCDGWCFPWAVTAAGGVQLCMRKVDDTQIWRLIHDEGVTHFSAAPTVLTMVANSADARPLAAAVQVHTGGAPPSPTLLARMSALNMNVTHLYGLTETYGPIAVNDWQPQWNGLSAQYQSKLLARQGVGNIVADQLRVVDTRGDDVPRDGSTVGEVVCRGNNVMLGYYRDEEATDAVTLGRWFRTGDLGVVHADGYIELRDRAKDIIISGGENIASVEVERVLDAHPAVLESAVVGRPDEKWGEVPVAFVSLRPGATVSIDELITFVRERLAHFKAPKDVVVLDLPRTSTGKVQKNVLREMLRAGTAD